jgi:hypothetical protein
VKAAARVFVDLSITGVSSSKKQQQKNKKKNTPNQKKNKKNAATSRNFFSTFDLFFRKKTETKLEKRGRARDFDDFFFAENDGKGWVFHGKNTYRS